MNNRLVWLNSMDAMVVVVLVSMFWIDSFALFSVPIFQSPVDTLICVGEFVCVFLFEFRYFLTAFGHKMCESFFNFAKISFHLCWNLLCYSKRTCSIDENVLNETDSFSFVSVLSINSLKLSGAFSLINFSFSGFTISQKTTPF